MRTAIRPLSELTSAVAAETALHKKSPAAYGHFRPNRSTIHPAGICSKVYDQKKADSRIPDASGESGKLLRISGRAEDRLIRSV
jgi:hypothetical protein